MPKSKHEFRRNFAIIIGIDDYSNGIPPLQTAVSDAKRLAEILESNDRNPKDKYDVIKSLDNAANLDGLLSLLESFKTASINLPDGSIHKIEEDSRLLFYFAGHGLILKDSLENEKSTKLEGYLVPQDASEKDITEAGTDPEKIEKVLLSMQDLHDAIEELPCRHVMVILDCCFAGAFRSTLSRDIVAARKVYKERYDRFIDSRAWQVITSASHDQKANDLLERFGQREKNEKGHSPFAQALFSCLSGQAEISSGRKDGIITATQLYVHLRDEVEVTTTENFSRQTPGIYPFSLEKHDKGEYIFLLPHFDPNNLEEAPALKPENNPYRGLFSYEESDAKLFFGRKTLIEELGKLVCNPDRNITIVIGASGSGKSSLVKAGLIPYLKDSKKPEVDRDWQILRPMRPGYFPFRELAKVIFLSQEDSCTPDSLSSEQLDDLEKRLRESNDILSIINSVKSKNSSPEKNNILLIIDQFEELTTFCKPKEKAAFLKFLKRVLDERSPGFHIVLTLRSDFEPQFQKSELEDYWNREKVQFRVEAMNLENFREVIMGPAEVAMLEFAPPTLVDRLVDDVAQMPGSLPLLSFALSQLYLNCAASDSRTITEENYQSIGEVKRVLSQQADKTFEKVKKEGVEEKIIRNVIVRMVTVRAGELARRRVPKSELKYPENSDDRGEVENQGDRSQLSVNEQVNKLIDSFVDARLMVTGKDEEGEYIEPAHDALVRGWSKITFWLEERQEITEKLSQYRQFTNWIGKGISHLKNGSAVKQQESERPLKINLPLQREVNTSANNWQQTKETEGNREAIGFLWNADPRLDLLKQVLSGEDNWLNQVEAEFVQHSVKRKTFNTRRNWSIAIAVILGLSGLTIWALNRQREMEISQIYTLLESSETQLNSNQILNARVNSLKAGKTLKQSFWASVFPDNALQKQVQGKLFQAIYTGQEVNRLEGHKLLVRTVVFSPNGRFLASGGDDGNVRLWNTSGKLLAVLEGHEKPVDSIAFSPNSKLIATGGHDNKVRIWNTSAQLLHEIKVSEEPENWVYSVAFSPNGKLLASGSKSIHLWDTSGKQLLELKGDEGWVYSIAFSPDGKLLASGGLDGTVRLWNMSGKQLAVIEGNNGQVRSVAFSPNGQLLASGSEDGTIRMFNTSGKELLKVKEHQDWVNSLAFSPNAKLLASGSNDGKVHLWNSAGKSLAVIEGHHGPVRSVAFNPDGNVLATSGHDGSIRLWDISDRPLVQLQRASKVDLSSNGTIGAFADYSTTYLWDTSGKQLLKLKADTEKFMGLMLSPDGKLLAIEINNLNNRKDNDKAIGLYDRSGRQLALLECCQLAFSPDSRHIVTGSNDGTVQLWDNLGAKLASLIGHTKSITDVAFSPNGKYIVTGSHDGTARLWNTSGQQLALFQGDKQQSRIGNVAFSPDSKFIATGGDTARLWNISSKQLTVLEGHQDVKVEFSPDGKFLITHAPASDVRLWDTSGKLIAELYGPQGNVYGGINSVAFSPDSQFLATTEFDGFLRLWDTSGEQLSKIVIAKNNAHSDLLFSTNAKFLVTLTSGEIIHLRQVGGLDELIAMNCELIGDYLKNSSVVKESERRLCDDIPLLDRNTQNQ